MFNWDYFKQNGSFDMKLLNLSEYKKQMKIFLRGYFYLLFEKVVVDVGGYGISWNDELDISAEELWENGCNTGGVHEIDIFEEVGYSLIKARDKAGVTQKELAEKVQIYQGDISKIERGQANPSVKTLHRLAEGMGMCLKVEFISKEK